MHAAAYCRCNVNRVTPHVGKHLCLQAHAHEPLGVGEASTRDGGRSDFQVFHAEGIKRAGDLTLLGGAEVGIGELFAFTECRIDNAEIPSHLGLRTAFHA